jgi:hypothetical protein
VQKTLGLQLSNMTDDLRKKYKIKDTIKGVVITERRRRSVAADKRLTPGSGSWRSSRSRWRRPADVAEEGRRAEEGRQEDRAASGRDRRRRHAVRGAADRVIAASVEMQRAARGRPFVLRQLLNPDVVDHAVGELGLEPGRFRRHDAAGVGHRHQVGHLRRIEREGRRHLAGDDPLFRPSSRAPPPTKSMRLSVR